MMTLERIQKAILKKSYVLSKHADQERKNDSLSIQEIKEAILSSNRILEYYEDTGRGESCLVVGFTDVGKPLHIVCGERNEKLVIVTVYIPSSPKFKNPYERG